MRSPFKSVLSAVPLICLFLSPAFCAKKDDKILLSSVHSLTLQADALTTHRRVSAVPQLTCKGPACPYFKVDSLRCTNAGTGYDDEDIQWTCTASLPSAFKLGSTDVQCEGYASSSDKHVLRGSCGATYRLLFTKEGEREYAEQLSHDRSSWFSKGATNQFDDSSSGGLSGKLFMVLFIAVAAWIVYNAYLRSTQQVQRRPRRAGGGGGGGGGGWGGGGPGGGGGGFGGWNTGSDPSDEPPPPYTPNPGPRYTKSAPSGSRSGQGWGAGLGNRGFWSGALGGAAAGYFAGSRRRNDPDPRRGWGAGSGGGGWGGSGSPGPSSSSSSGRTHESTGFGGTSRR